MGCATGTSAYDAVAALLDPEMPMVTLADLGIVRDVYEDLDTGAVMVTITPTYSGCPAMATIRDDIVASLHRHGHCDVEIRVSLQPAWSTDWITEAGRRQLAQAGCSPPGPAPRRTSGPVPLTLTARPRMLTCPQCGSNRTRLISEFGATLCKAQYQCSACGEPFDHVKEI
jgi:ring-1,2-phenylacetyl-CoA epoxidase subunit PaaD